MKNISIVLSLALTFATSLGRTGETSGMIHQESRADLYVSPDGDDGNSGEDPDHPLKTITHALEIVQPDMANPCTIHLSAGIYSQNTNGETIPLTAVGNTTLQGESVQDVIILGENVDKIWSIEDVEYFGLSHMTLKSESPTNIGAIVRCSNSIVLVDHVLVTHFQNTRNYIWRQFDNSLEYSVITFNYVTFADNSAGGIVAYGDSHLIINNSIFWNNNPLNLNTRIINGPEFGIDIDHSVIEGGINSLVMHETGSLIWGSFISTTSPLFCDPAGDDYSLAENSSAAELGADGLAAGALPVACAPQTLWTGPTYFVSLEGADITGNGSPDLPYQSIQRAVNTTIPGDTVIVRPGHYFGNLKYYGRDIVVASEFILTQQDSTIQQTIIDADSVTGSVVEFIYGETNTAELIGFTLTGGTGHWFDGSFGGGIFCSDSSPTLKHLIIRNNYLFIIGFTGGIGGGVFINDASPILENIQIDHNSAYFGGAVYIQGNSSVWMDKMTISNNYVIDSLFVQGNTDGIVVTYGSNLYMTNSILWNNGTENYTFIGEVDIQYSDIQDGWDGTGNIDTAPLFVDPENGDYHLQPDSPCIDAGDPDSPVDPDGTIADMGAWYSYHCNPCTLPGDVSGDGVINIQDVVMTVDCILEFSNDCSCADMDNSCTVDILDIVFMVWTILGE